jgi:cinnamyl-alcohol dehydrogenase
MINYFSFLCFFSCYAIRVNGDNDITIKILYCGICHSDLHIARNDFGISIYPVVPGYAFIRS